MTEAEAAHGEFSQPSDAVVSATLSRLGDPHHRRVFYSELQNPLWVEPLHRLGGFGAPTEAIQDSDGIERSEPWPEGDYLARMASQAPEEVVAVLLPLSATTNRLAQRSIIDAALTLPAAYSAELAQPIIAYLDQVSIWRDPRALADLVVKLLAEGHTELGQKMADSMYRPRLEPGKRADAFGHVDVSAAVDRHSYDETLPAVVEALVASMRHAGLRMVVSWLENYQIGTRNFDPGSGAEYAHVWRPSIAPHEQNAGLEQIGDALVDAVRGGVRQLMRVAGPKDALRGLINSKQALVLRIAMDAIADFLRGDEPEDYVLEVARRFAFDPIYLSSDFRLEYSRLIRALASHLTPGEAERWTRLVLDGPPHTDDEVETVLGYFRPSDAPPVTSDEIEAFCERWRRDVLAAVGIEHLPGTSADLLRGLEETHGRARDHVEFPSYTESFTGPVSPLTTDEMRRLSVGELIQRLTTWEPPDEAVFGPTAEGLGRSLTELVTEEPAKYGPHADRFATLEPTYVRALLDGLERAVNSGQTIEWSPVLTLMESAAAHELTTDDEDFNLERDRGWRWTRQTCASLLRSAADKQPELVCRHGLRSLGILERIARDPNPSVEHERRYGGDNMDPLTLSLNTVRPVTLRAVIRGLAANANCEKPDEEYRTRALALLDEHLGVDRDPSLAVQAVFGEFLGLLLGIEHDWTQLRLPRILSEPASRAADATPGPDTVWSVFLATHRPGPWMLRELEPYFEQKIDGIRVGRPETVGWNTQRTPREMLGDALVILYLQGHLPGKSQDFGLLGRYFAAADNELRGSELEHLGWLLGHSETLPTEFITRAQDLWDDRVDQVVRGLADASELSGFDSWIRSGHFQIEWWIERLLMVLQQTGLNHEFGIGEALGEAAASGFEALSIEITQLMLHDENEWGHYELMQHVPGILARCLDHQDGTVRSAAEQLLDDLGRRGHVAVGPAVARLRSSE